MVISVLLEWYSLRIDGMEPRYNYVKGLQRKGSRNHRRIPGGSQPLRSTSLGWRTVLIYSPRPAGNILLGVGELGIVVSHFTAPAKQRI